MIRVAFDGRALNREHLRGIGRFSWELITRAGKFHPIEWEIFADRPDLPMHTPVAIPAALIVATVVVAEAQVTWLVRSCVDASEKVPVAVNCCVSPLATLGLAGVRAIEARAG